MAYRVETFREACSKQTTEIVVSNDLFVKEEHISDLLLFYLAKQYTK